jgi:hypothetical protein
MRLIGVAMLRNEADIVEAFVRHHAALLDQLVVVDHGSTDATPRILAALVQEGLPLEVHPDPATAFRQDERLTVLARDALERRGADVVFPLDADEFLRVGTRAGLEALLQPLAATGVARLPWSLQVASAPDASEPHPLRRLRWRVQLPASNMWKCVLGCGLLEAGQWRLAPGSHWVLHDVDGKVKAVDAPAIEALPLSHLPFRSPEQYLGKIVQGWLAHRLRAGPLARSSPINAHWRTLYDRWLAGETPDWAALQEHALTWYALNPAPDARAFARDEISLIEDPLPAIEELRHTPAQAADPLRRLAAWTERLLDSLAPDSR